MKSNYLVVSIVLITSIFFSGCLEFIEEIDLQRDGSGEAHYTINMSQSKIKLATSMQLDSIFGIRIPNEQEIEKKILSTVNFIKEQKGISSCSYESNYADFIFKLNISFTDINSLNHAINNLPYWETSDWKPTEDLYKFSSHTFSKKIDAIDMQKVLQKMNEHKTDLQQGNYISIVRLKNEITSSNGTNIKLSGNKNAAMVKSNLYEIIRNPQSLSYDIQF